MLVALIFCTLQLVEPLKRKNEMRSVRILGAYPKGYTGWIRIAESNFVSCCPYIVLKSNQYEVHGERNVPRAIRLTKPLKTAVPFNSHLICKEIDDAAI